MPVSFKRKELRDLLPQYDIVGDCIAGEQTIKKKGQAYLPHPSPDPDEKLSAERYQKYVLRAQFYNVTKRTLHGLVGQIFLREPIVELPPSLDAVHWDATGGGVTLEQLSKAGCIRVLGYGRAGLFVDYPKTAKPASRADLSEGNIRPTITVIEPRNVINWRIIRKGAKEYLSLVVIEEKYVEEDDGFMQTMKTQWRALRLNDAGNYYQEIYRDENKPAETINPVDASGNPLKEIPFLFIGSEDNSAEPDSPPLYDLASLNIGHYRNSADYEESCFMVGQPTPFLTGLTTDWIKDVLKGEILLGSRTAIALPVEGSAGLLQAAPNSMPFEAMQHKERQMVALGAKLVEERAVQRTATEATQEQSSELSVLASVAQNVGSAIATALEWCAKFIGVPDTGIKFELNSEFDLTKMSPEERRQLIAEWQGGAIAWEEMRENLRRAAVATLDDDEARRKIDNELAAMPDLGGEGGKEKKLLPAKLTPEQAAELHKERLLETGHGMVIEKAKKKGK